MFIKKPFITLVLFIGMGLLALFSISYIWLPVVQSNHLVMAIAEALAIVLGLMAFAFVVLYFIVKKQKKSGKENSGIVSKLQNNITRLPLKEKESPVVRMPMAG